ALALLVPAGVRLAQAEDLEITLTIACEADRRDAQDALNAELEKHPNQPKSTLKTVVDKDALSKVAQPGDTKQTTTWVYLLEEAVVNMTYVKLCKDQKSSNDGPAPAVTVGFVELPPELSKSLVTG